MQFELVKATETDKDFLLTLRKATMVEHLEKAGLFLSDEQHQLRIDHCFDDAYIIHHLGAVAGYIKFQQDSKQLTILQLQISPPRQAQGIGSMVLEYFIQQCKDSDKLLKLGVLKQNPARHLYQKLGFITVAEDQYEYQMELQSA